MNALADRAAADIMAAMGMLPESFWEHGDDACDCTFQRIGMWTNPYLAQTLEVRMCCIWAKLAELFPEFVRVTPAFLDYNAGEWATTPRAWDGEEDMPRGLWYRQLARESGRSVADVRAEYRDRTPPQGTPRPVAEPEVTIDPVMLLFDLVGKLALEVKALKEAMV